MKKLVIVTGGRSYSGKTQLFAALDDIGPDVVYQGGCSGADLLALDYCKVRGKKCRTFDADWEKFGKKAGPMRNREMVEAAIATATNEGMKPFLVAFPGGRGTANCIKEAVARSIRVIEVKT